MDGPEQVWSLRPAEDGENAVRSREVRPPTVTHYVPWDAPGKRFVTALCGVHITRREHANKPTCPTCAAMQAEHEARDI